MNVRSSVATRTGVRKEISEMNEKVELSFVGLFVEIGNVESELLRSEVVLYVRIVIDDIGDDIGKASNNFESVRIELSFNRRLNGVPAIVVDLVFLLVELLKAFPSHESFFRGEDEFV